jgi:hypothetical protein
MNTKIIAFFLMTLLISFPLTVVGLDNNKDIDERINDYDISICWYDIISYSSIYFFFFTKCIINNEGPKIHAE